MPQSQEAKEWPGLWAVLGVKTGGSALRPVGGNLWVSIIVVLLSVSAAIFSGTFSTFYKSKSCTLKTNSYHRIDWETTDRLLRKTHYKLKEVLPARIAG